MVQKFKKMYLCVQVDIIVIFDHMNSKALQKLFKISHIEYFNSELYEIHNLESWLNSSSNLFNKISTQDRRFAKILLAKDTLAGDTKKCFCFVETSRLSILYYV